MKFLVNLRATRFYSTDIEIEAKNEEEAEGKALEMGGDFDWSGHCDIAEYESDCIERLSD